MSDKRQDLIEAAIDLFAKHGFHATGIDLIAAEAQVSKKTMYNHFRSKEELIVAALKHYDGRFRNFFMKSVEQSVGTPSERLLSIFDVAHEWFASTDFHGCLFINAIGEYSDRNSAITQACKEYKRLMRSYIEELAVAAQITDAKKLADELALLLEGSIVTAQVSGLSGCADSGKHAAKILIDHAIAGNG